LETVISTDDLKMGEGRVEIMPEKTFREGLLKRKSCRDVKHYKPLKRWLT